RRKRADVLDDLRNEFRILGELCVIHTLGGITRTVVILMSGVRKKQIRHSLHAKAGKVAARTDEISANDEHLRLSALLQNVRKLLRIFGAQNEQGPGIKVHELAAQGIENDRRLRFIEWV